MRPRVFIVASAFCVGCTGESTGPTDHIDATFDAGPFTVEAGTETVMCTYVRADNDTDEDIVRFTTAQSALGHHLIVYTVDHAIDLPPSPCSQGGQPSWNQILVTQLRSETQAFPAGIGYHVHARQQYVLETHYINPGTTAEQATSSVSLTYGPAGSVTTRAGSYFFGTMNLDVPPNTPSWTKTVACSPPAPMQLRTMFGHEHRHGTGVDVALLPAAGGTKPVYATTQWDAPPIATYDAGLTLGASDRIQVTCDYANDGPTSLHYPNEMCFAVGYYWPAEGEVFCASGGGDDTCVCQNTFTDTGPGGARIDVAVGRLDTITGAKGDLASGAPIYCILFRAQDYTLLGPKADALPYGFTQSIGTPLATSQDAVHVGFDDVTPGDYAVVCLMDTIGGGFVPGTGDVVNSKEVVASPAIDKPASVDVVLDYALP